MNQPDKEVGRQMRLESKRLSDEAKRLRGEKVDTTEPSSSVIKPVRPTMSEAITPIQSTVRQAQRISDRLKLDYDSIPDEQLDQAKREINSAVSRLNDYSSMAREAERALAKGGYGGPDGKRRARNDRREAIRMVNDYADEIARVLDRYSR